MASTFTCLYVHLVFSTKNRMSLIWPEWQDSQWGVMAAIAERHRIVPFAIGGVENHVHLLLSLPATVTIAQAAQWIKGASSHWVHETQSEAEGFAWQEGYAAFTVGVRSLDRTRRYIQSQREHHAAIGYEDELKRFLGEHGVAYDERFVFG